MKKAPKKTYTPIEIALGIACAVAVVVLIVVAIAPWKQQKIVMGEFTPPPFDPAAVSGVPEVDESLGWSDVPIRAGYAVKVCGELRANPDGSLPIWFYADSGNTVWVKLRVLDEKGDRLGETGLLRPGEYVELVQLNEKAVSGKVTLHIMGYEPETYYSAGAINFETVLQMP